MTKDQRRFLALGEFLHGRNWKKPLARALEKNEKTIRRWAKGDWDVPPDVIETMAAMATKKQEKLKRSTGE